jgi:PBSX family phage terminase large subunit
MYFNEISQISYDAVELGLTRLAQNIPGYRNTAYFDCNPPSPLHWSHKLFIEKVDPKNPKNRLGNSEDYFSMLMNPKDNEENLSPDFFRRLENLSDRAKRRMLLGEWGKAEGTIYERFDQEHIIKEDELPEKFEEITGGLDFGLNMAAVRIGWAGDMVYVIDDHAAYDTTSREFNSQMKAKWGTGYPETIYADPSGGERLQEISNSAKANNSVEEGIDCINTLIAQNRFRVCEKATNVLNEIMDYRREVVTTRLGISEKIVKMNDHFMDAVRYAIFSRIARPLQIFL